MSSAQQSLGGSNEYSDPNVEHLRTKHVSVKVVDNDETKITIDYWEDCGDPACPVKGRAPRPFSIYVRRCPSGPC
jgi:hypothetical protein